MSVVPLRKYSYLDWVTITARNDARRASRGLFVWPAAMTDQLWRDLFGEG